MIVQLDGWCVSVTWEQLYYGDTFFLPSVNWKFDKLAVQQAADTAGCDIVLKGVIENGIRGVRVWIIKPC